MYSIGECWNSFKCFDSIIEWSHLLKKTNENDLINTINNSIAIYLNNEVYFEVVSRNMKTEQFMIFLGNSCTKLNDYVNAYRIQTYSSQNTFWPIKSIDVIRTTVQMSLNLNELDWLILCRYGINQWIYHYLCSYFVINFTSHFISILYRYLIYEIFLNRMQDLVFVP